MTTPRTSHSALRTNLKLPQIPFSTCKPVNKLSLGNHFADQSDLIPEHSEMELWAPLGRRHCIRYHVCSCVHNISSFYNSHRFFHNLITPTDSLLLILIICCYYLPVVYSFILLLIYNILIDEYLIIVILVPYLSVA